MTHPAVLFVCPHGSAKSVIAAAHFTRLASQRGLAVRGIAAGLEPDSDIPPHVREGLDSDGLPAPSDEPRGVSREVVHGVHLAVTIGCDLSPEHAPERVIRWDGVPAVSDGYGAAREAIVERVSRLLDDLDLATITNESSAAMPGEAAAEHEDGTRGRYIPRAAAEIPKVTVPGKRHEDVRVDEQRGGANDDGRGERGHGLWGGSVEGAALY